LFSKVKVAFEFLKQVPFNAGNLDITRLQWDDSELNRQILIATEPHMLFFASELRSFTLQPQISDIYVDLQIVFHSELNCNRLPNKDFPNLLLCQVLSELISV